MTTDTDTDRALKAAHRNLWGLGDYSAVARDLIPDLGEALVAACRVAPGHDVLDVAAGTGNAAIPAALRGARVTATDLTPRLLEIGQREADAVGAQLTWQEADVEALPFDTAAFDTVMSCVGVMFAPHHEASAAEVLRVCRPGGTIGLINWTPEGFIGQMFATMKPYAAPPPPGASPAPLWGKEEHVTGLFGDSVGAVTATRRVVGIDHFTTPEEFRDYFKANYGPTIATYERLAEDAEQTAALDAALAELARRHMKPDGGMEWEYLLLTATRA
jgi:ubiquinone/menaquinone biosynthesis C-methylase UbiE